VPLSSLTLPQQLIYLQDMDLLLRDARDAEATKLWEKAGLRITGVEQVRRVRMELAKSIPPRWLALYERVFSRYGRALVPVRDGTCLKCFVKLPTGATAMPAGADSIATCESCGCILYWP
jgi:predicted  nucleic acid-binding Zn-ribbon protein